MLKEATKKIFVGALLLKEGGRSMENLFFPRLCVLLAIGSALGDAMQVCNLFFFLAVLDAFSLALVRRTFPALLRLLG